MHELALGQAIIDTIDRRADGRDVRQVTVRIGHLRQVVPDSLQFAWEMLTEGSDHLSGCRLVIDHVAAVVACRECDARTTLELPILVCATCASFDVELVSGEEFQIATMDVAESAGAQPDHARLDHARPDHARPVN